LNLVPVLILYLIKASVLCELKKNSHHDCYNSMSIDSSKYITQTSVYVPCLYSEPADNLQVIVFWYLWNTVAVFVMALCFKWLHVTEMKHGRCHIRVHAYITYHKQFCWFWLPEVHLSVMTEIISLRSCTTYDAYEK